MKLSHIEICDTVNSLNFETTKNNIEILLQ